LKGRSPRPRDRSWNSGLWVGRTSPLTGRFATSAKIATDTGITVSAESDQSRWRSCAISSRSPGPDDRTVEQAVVLQKRRNEREIQCTVAVQRRHQRRFRTCRRYAWCLAACALGFERRAADRSAMIAGDPLPVLFRSFLRSSSSCFALPLLSHLRDWSFAHCKAGKLHRELPHAALCQ